MSKDIAQMIRILYFDSRDGEVLYDTGYIEEGENPIEENFLVVEKMYDSRSNISAKLLREHEYAEQFAKYDYCRIIVPTGDIFFHNNKDRYHLGYKHNMTDRWFPLFSETSGLVSNGFINESLLRYYYNDFIEYNLKTACKVLGYEWLKPSQLERKNDVNRVFVVKWEDGDLPSYDEFTEELKSNSCIFPFQIRKKGRKNIILDGSHKAQALIKSGSDRDILSVLVKTSNMNLIGEKIDIKFDEKVVMHIPTQLMDKYGFINFLSKTPFDDKVLEVSVDKYLYVVALFRMYVNELTIPMRLYKTQFGKVFPGSPYIENREMFEKWIDV